MLALFILFLLKKTYNHRLSTQDKFRKDLLPQVNRFLEIANSDMWERISEVYGTAQSTTFAKFGKRLDGTAPYT